MESRFSGFSAPDVLLSMNPTFDKPIGCFSSSPQGHAIPVCLYPAEIRRTLFTLRKTTISRRLQHSCHTIKPHPFASVTVYDETQVVVFYESTNFMPYIS